jgi:phosphatidate cytidylyltransferase
MSNLAKRLIFAFTAMPIVAFLMWFGDLTRIAFVLFLNAVAAWEWARMVNTAYPGPSMSVVSPLAALAFTGIWVFLRYASGYFYPFPWDTLMVLGLAGLALVFFLYIVAAFAKVDVKYLFPWLVLQVAGPLYVGFWGGSTLMLFERDGQGWLQCAPFLIVMTTMWACDSAAYFAGRFLGKRKLSPQISPKKTWAGAVGGTLFAMFWFMLWTGPIYPVFRVAVWKALLFALLICVVGQMGDLLMSALKRWSGIKDSGSIFPGHGGVLDRADSFYLAGPVAVLLLNADTYMFRNAYNVIFSF